MTTVNPPRPRPASQPQWPWACLALAAQCLLACWRLEEEVASCSPCLMARVPGPLGLLQPDLSGKPPPPQSGATEAEVSMKAQLMAAVASEDYEAVKALADSLLVARRRRLGQAPAPAGRQPEPTGIVWAGTGGVPLEAGHDEVLLRLAKKRRPQLKLRYGFDSTVHTVAGGAPVAEEEKAFPRALYSIFVRLELDQVTLDFLQGPPPSDAAEKNAHADREKMTNTDRIALLATHAMHVLSTGQFSQLLGRKPSEARGHLLDIGAGTGAVTAELAPLFSTVTTTEISVQMAAQLRGRGYDCVPASGSGDVAAEVRAHLGCAPPEYDTIALLNVLDRCSEPMTMLAR